MSYPANGCILIVDTTKWKLMKTRIQKWGNSLAIRIPKGVAEDATLHLDSEVELLIVDGQLVIAPVHEDEYRLEDLLAQVSDENLHSEADFGAAVGDEVW